VVPLAQISVRALSHRAMPASDERGGQRSSKLRHWSEGNAIGVNGRVSRGIKLGGTSHLVGSSTGEEHGTIAVDHTGCSSLLMFKTLTLRSRHRRRNGIGRCTGRERKAVAPGGTREFVEKVGIRSNAW
jgi:hypothetical protein